MKRPNPFRPAGAAVVALALALSLPAHAGEDGGNDRRTTIADTGLHDFPLSFRSQRGGRFQPDRLVILGRDGTWATALPATADRVESHDHVDFSNAPLVGKLFKARRAPVDVERRGLPVGTVLRSGDTLILDARAHAVPLTSLPLTLSSALPRLGTVGFELRPRSYQRAAAPAGPTARVGAGYLLENRLYLVADGTRPPLQHWFGGG